MNKILKAIFPSPLLTVCLILLWLTINATLHPAHILLAVILGITVPLFTKPLRPTPVKIQHPLKIIKLFLTVIYDSIVSNIQVAAGAMRFGDKKPQGEFIKIPLEIRDPNALAVLALICTIVPGTIWVELALDRSAVYIHAFDSKDIKQEIKHFKTRYEKPLMEIFE